MIVVKGLCLLQMLQEFRAGGRDGVQPGADHGLNTVEGRPGAEAGGEGRPASVCVRTDM